MSAFSSRHYLLFDGYFRTFCLSDAKGLKSQVLHVSEINFTSSFNLWSLFYRRIIGHIQKLDRIGSDRSPWMSEKQFCKPKLQLYSTVPSISLKVTCSLNIMTRVISRGRTVCCIIVLRRSEVSWSELIQSDICTCLMVIMPSLNK